VLEIRDFIIKSLVEEIPPELRNEDMLASLKEWDEKQPWNNVLRESLIYGDVEVEINRPIDGGPFTSQVSVKRRRFV